MQLSKKENEHLQCPLGLVPICIAHGLGVTCHCSLLDVLCIVLMTCIALMTCKGCWLDLHCWLMLCSPMVQLGLSRHTFNTLCSCRLVSSVLCSACFDSVLIYDNCLMTGAINLPNYKPTPFVPLIAMAGAGDAMGKAMPAVKGKAHCLDVC